MERPPKRVKLDSDSSSDESNDGVLSINKEYARRFEHNKQREEQHQLEEKYDTESESSSDESEDDDADLITADLDQEIQSTLNAIKSKDPRVYDKTTTFYRSVDQPSKARKEAPMTLSDYHRENILAGHTGAQEGEEEDEDVTVPHTYQQEQDKLRQDIIGQLHTLAEENSDDDFKVKAKHSSKHLKHRTMTSADIAAADKDPETYLSNFMASQAWRPAAEEGSRPTFDSDDSEEDDRADALEQAYNMRFEDPATSNEKLKSFARDAQYSVRRRETQNARQKARDREREQKKEAKAQRVKERERLRKLKISEAEEKLKAIRHAAGLHQPLVDGADVEEWRDLLEGEFDEKDWDREMQARFGEPYYAEPDVALFSEDGVRQKIRKPTWNEADIDVNDIAPELADLPEDSGGFTLTDDEKVDAKQESTKAKQDKKRDRRLIEQMVEASLPVASVSQGVFRYRDTSPVSFGMRAQDILFASDAQLNTYAGIKKLASFRDDNRKAKDRKRLSKKARLREWRKDVFGNEDGPSISTEMEVRASTNDDDSKSAEKNKKKRKRKSKQKATTA